MGKFTNIAEIKKILESRERLTRSDNYLLDLMQAIRNVNRNYYYHFDVEYCERSFAYELYHQWSKFVDYYRSHDDTSICINGEVSKLFDQRDTFPDMVMHEEGGNRQEIVVEIKRLHPYKYKSELILADFQKLANFMTELIGVKVKKDRIHQFQPYKYGVFVCIGMKEELVDILKDEGNRIKTIINQLGQRNKNLLCVFTEHTEGNMNLQLITIHELYSLIKDKESNQTNYNN